MAMFKKLTADEEKEYRAFVDEDVGIQSFINRVSLFHPVIRDEIIKRLRK
jgi:hypothetical protein